MHNFTMHVLMPASIGLVALAFIGLGLYVLVKRRPVVLHARWMLVTMLIVLLPPILQQASVMLSDQRPPAGDSGLMFAVILLMPITIVALLVVQMRGYFVFGATQESFRAGLLSALANLGLSPEETVSTIRLPSVPAELNVMMHGSMGTGQLRLRSGGSSELLARIAYGMRRHFDEAPGPTNLVSPVLHVVFGSLMGLMTYTMMRLG